MTLKPVLIFATLLGAFCPAAAMAGGQAQERQIGAETQMPFKDFRSVRNYEADGERGIWIEDSLHNWYYAKVDGFCPNLGFANRVVFQSRNWQVLDREARVFVGDEQCDFTSFVTAEKPLPLKERMKVAAAARAAARAASAHQ